VLAAVCGYVCPSETLCESGCINEHYTEPVPIRHLQRWVSRKAVEEGWAAEPRPSLTKTGKRVAVIGAGPAGVAGAVTLASLGHQAVMFERAPKPGGVARETIPADRLPDPIINRELQDVLTSAGLIERRHDFSSLDALMEEGFHAVLLAPGLSRSLPLPGATRPAAGVIGAIEFLREAKRGRRVEGTVLVLGGGNTAIDAALSALRAGASDVSIVYRRSFAEMPAWPNERDAAIKGGVNFLILTQPLDYVAGDGVLTPLKVARTRLGKPDITGRRRPEVLPNSEHMLPANFAIETLGQQPDESLRDSLKGVEFTRAGLIAIRSGEQATSRPGVFAAGDIVNGGATVVDAVAEGAQAAREIDIWLR
jgi:heterodisulfide reductase subunit A